jgi:hypothetical protein
LGSLFIFILIAGRNDSVDVSLVKTDLLPRPVDTLHLECHVIWAVFYNTGLGGSKGEQLLPILDIYLISLAVAVTCTTYSIRCWKYPCPTL